MGKGPGIIFRAGSDEDMKRTTGPETNQKWYRKELEHYVNTRHNLNISLGQTRERKCKGDLY
jgi:cytolysin (calcineurin-like family phosphatase)